MTTCLNCGHVFEGNFCSNCGQKATVERLTAAVLLRDALHFFSHIEHGFLFTSWNFIVRPGISSMNYLSGRRRPFQSPASFFLIWTGLYILVHNAVISYGHYQIPVQMVNELNIREQSNVLFRNHFSVFILPVILLSSFLSYIILAKPRYNFTEVLTICLYGAGDYFMMCLVSDFILGLGMKMNILTIAVFLWQSVLSAVYNFWFSFDFYNRLHLRFFWVRLIATSVLIGVSGLLIMLYLPIAWMYFRNIR
jgi:hypothetical protein